MTVRLFAMTCGWLTMPAKFILDGMAGELRLPIPGYLIVHPKGKAIFDSGLHTSLQTNPAERLGAMDAITKVEFRPGEELRGRLATLDVAPENRGELEVQRLRTPRVKLFRRRFHDALARS